MRYHWLCQRRLFVGSGIVEASCKTVVGQRLKQSGMHLTVNGAHAIIVLRCKEASSSWETVCNTPHTQTHRLTSTSPKMILPTYKTAGPPRRCCAATEPGPAAPEPAAATTASWRTRHKSEPHRLRLQADLASQLARPQDPPRSRRAVMAPTRDPPICILLIVGSSHGGAGPNGKSARAAHFSRKLHDDAARHSQQEDRAIAINKPSAAVPRPS
jgi:hypothetical protein